MPALASPSAGKSVVRVAAPVTSRGRACKRMIDLCGSAILLCAAAPLILVFACIVRWQDGGPAFYRRRVIGQHGQFDAFKLRSMRVDAEEMLERDSELKQRFSANFKLHDDPRVTPAGAVMRRYGIDELPQLWNVLRGEMSLVGPRMISPAELSKFGEAAEIFNLVKPGITGYWQIERRTQASYAERVEMELTYVNNWSLTNDFIILMKTPLRVLSGKGNS